MPFIYIYYIDSLNSLSDKTLNNRLKYSLYSICLSLSLGSASSFASAPLKSERIQQLTTLEVVDKLEQRHYINIPIDNKLSQDFLTSFIKSIDANRQVFLEGEIADFTKKYGSSLDDALKKGDLSPAYVIFNVYQQRMNSLLSEQLAHLDKTIDGLDFTLDESIQIDRSEAAWPKSLEEVNILFAKRLKSAVLSLKLAGKEPAKIKELLNKRYKNQLDRLSKLNGEDVYQIYMNAFTQLYDPHTNYLSPASSENFDISMSLKLEGIGAMLSSKNGYTEVVRLIHAGPAWKNGELKPKDRITGVAQGSKEIVDIEGWRLDDVVKIIRGSKGSKVRLEIIPAKSVSDDERTIINITRDEVKLEEQSVQKAMIEVKDSKGQSHKFGILDVPTFYLDFDAYRKRDPNYRSTTRDTAKLLSELVREGAEGIVIDLRNNGGGSLREANELTSLFIERGPSVQIKNSKGAIHTEAKTYFSPYYDGPLIVLINRMSASASEIFAGAMQDYKRALIIGSPSFGKGTVQQLLGMNHGKLKVTESKFYRISGESTQHRGVVPDINLPKIYDDTIIGESVLDHVLNWDKIAPAKYSTADSITPYLGPLSQQSGQRIASVPDFIYYNEKLDYEDSLEFEFLSLNKVARKAFRDKDEAARLTIENKLRVAKGEKPLKDLDGDDEEDETEEEDADAPLNEIDLEDAFLLESANVLLDLITLSRTK